MTRGSGFTTKRSCEFTPTSHHVRQFVTVMKEKCRASTAVPSSGTPEEGIAPTMKVKAGERKENVPHPTLNDQHWKWNACRFKPCAFPFCPLSNLLPAYRRE